jgi:hypothetical protein
LSTLNGVLLGIFEGGYQVAAYSRGPLAIEKPQPTGGGDRRQDANNNNDDQQLDEGKPRLRVFNRWAKVLHGRAPKVKKLSLSK